MIDSNGIYHQEDRSLEYERLFSLLDKLDSIIYEARVQGYSEQFILGLIASTDVVRAEIKGFPHKKLGSIDDPNQLPLI